jgi:hypothetical protein
MTERKGTAVVGTAVDESVLDRSLGARAAGAAPAEPALDRPTQGRIGDQLRAMYDDLLNQPVPDRLASLLRQLDGDGSDKSSS